VKPILLMVVHVHITMRMVIGFTVSGENSPAVYLAASTNFLTDHGSHLVSLPQTRFCVGALDRHVLPVIDSQQVHGDSADESETAFFRDLWVSRFGRREVEHSNSLPLRKVL
jgi:hypothetical protein